MKVAELVDDFAAGRGREGLSLTHREALEVLAARRGRHVVITTHGSVDLWVSLSDTPLDLAYVPASMGQAPALALPHGNAA